MCEVTVRSSKRAFFNEAMIPEKRLTDSTLMQDTALDNLGQPTTLCFTFFHLFFCVCEKKKK